MKNIWEILEIDATKDIKLIKKAYAKKAKQFHPEENPEDFKIIQEAYQMAINYARNNNEEIDSSESIIENVEKNIDKKDLKESNFFNIDTDINIDDNKDEKFNEEDCKLKNNENEFDVCRLFRSLEYDEISNDEMKKMNDSLDELEKKIPQKIDMNMFKKILSNPYVKHYIKNYYFKEGFERILLKRTYADTLYTEKKMAEIARNNNLLRVAREIERNTKRRYIIGIRTPVFIAWIVIIIFINIFVLQMKKDRSDSYLKKSINKNITNASQDINKVKESFLKTNLIMNESMINGYNVEMNELGYYIIKDKSGYIARDKISFLEFTMTKNIIFKKSKVYYVLNTENSKIVPTNYKKVKSANILKNNNKEIGLVAYDKDNKWYIIDNEGNKLKHIDGNKNGAVFDVIVENNGKAKFLEE